METLPRIQVKPLFGFYLGPWPHAASGGEAIIYAPAYNDHVRNRQIRKGFNLLSQCGGSFSEGGDDALYILPPADEAIREMIRTLRKRLPAEQAKTAAEIEEVREILEDSLMSADERQQYRARLRALLKRQKDEAGIPTFREAKTFFMREYHARIALQVPEQFRQTIRLIAQETELAQKVRETWETSEDYIDQVEAEVAEEISEGALDEELGANTAEGRMSGGRRQSRRGRDAVSQ